MKTTTFEIESKVNELLAVLDMDIEHIQESLSRLNELRGLIVKRDEREMEELLESIQTESGVYVNNESKRQSIRKKLAGVLGFKLKNMTLAALEDVLEGEKRIELSERKEKLKPLVEQLKKEHLRTSMLLSDCARFNSLLLRNILNPGNTETVTYSSNGITKRHRDNSLMNLQF